MTALRSALAIFALVFASNSFAAMGGDGWSLGLHLGVVNSTQTQMNEFIKRANVGGTGPVGTSELTSAYEVAPFLQYRFGGTMYAVHFRPSFFYQSQSGSGDDGSYDVSVTGWTFFPMLRLYPLENDFMKFYMQFGLGYGRAMGEINEGAGNKVSFESGSFGTLLGMGAEFCFNANHCFNLEGDYRYLAFERNIVKSSSGTFDYLSQYGKGQELEMDGADVSVRMGGLMFLAGYTMWF